ncbi:MAG TPA: tetratricopeptide repeat protein, partial [Pyrinomonadaceae bacterium]|nr:tetratricopeptide repeat protein [Pyrinomonadaceae bacterium]
ILPAFLLSLSALTIAAPAQTQDENVTPRPAITVLDSTKEQDGLVGSVRRVKTETAKIELKDGRPVEGPTQLIEITTYGVKGNRIENTSYPSGGAFAGKEEYKYDDRGNITEMTVRNDRGAILTREAYSYEFDKFGNWTRMVTSLIVFENGKLKREPVEVTYRTVTYYFDDTVAKIVEEPKAPVTTPAPVVEEPKNTAPPVVEEPKNTAPPPIVEEPKNTAPPVVEKPKPVLAAHVPLPTEGALTAPDSPKLSLVSFESNLTAVGEPPSVPSVKSAAKPAPAPETTVNTDAYELYVTGRQRFDTGDAPGAIQSYLQSLKLEPGSAEVQLSLGHAYLRIEKDRDAIKAFKESIKLNPEMAETHYGLGFANFRLGRFRDAADAFKKATTLAPRMAKAHYGLSLAYQELGNTTALMEEYRILESLDKSLAKKLAQTFPQFNFSCRLMQGCP